MTLQSRFLLNFAGLGLVVSMLGAPGAATAGFLFESTPPAPQPVKAQVDAPKKAESVPAVAGRNVDQSAKVDRLARMNRQRIDLESKLTSRITQSGDSPAELPAIKGMGRSVSLEDALRQILPTGWGAYSDQDLPLNDLVNWSGNRTWPMVLHGLLAERDMRAHIDWKNQEVMFFAPAPKDEVTQPLLAGPGKGVEVRVAEAPKPQAAAPAALPAVAAAPDLGKLAETKKEVVWVLSPEHTLRENLRRWASAAGWNLVWNAVSGDSVIDYPVDAKVEFSGELLGGNGAMAKVIIAYSDADFPLEIEFFRGNRVVEVRLHQVPDVKSATTTAQASVPPRAPLAAIGEAPALHKTQDVR
ncbi:TcpQ domain-containing protein [Roseateles asaccharophilus]|uniref:TcpQ domain-containing protein n=1 Tax=Roseateles asaccharophilus TaxID=582607 RepID=UPI003850B968